MKQMTITLELLREMLRIRMVEEAIANHYPEQEMRCPVHLSIGQEAIAVGVCKAALHSDYLISNHRAHAHYLAKGGSLKAMMAEIYGKKTGCSHGRGGSMHLVDRSVGIYGTTPIVGGSIPIGVGLAFATKMQKEKNITLVFLGEGATEEGVFCESLNFASLKKLPVLFLCENNYYSVYSPLEVRQPKEKNRVEIARAHGLYVDSGYGNDVEEVYKKASRAIAQIRSEFRPAYLEFNTYRHREHCGPFFDNHIGYRTEEEFRNWEKQDPISLSKEKLFNQRDLTAQNLSKWKEEIEQEILDAFTFAKNSPFPSYDSNFENPFAELHT